MNWKCLIGAVIATPIAAGLIVGFCWGVAWLVCQIPYARIVWPIMVFGGLGFFIWCGLYIHCVEWHERRGKNEKV